jgi:hypothetical protein
MELNPLKIPISSLAAPAAVIIFVAFLAISAGRFPQGFSPLDAGMSELGDASLNPDGAGIFNSGCMIAGFSIIIFFLGIYKWYADELWRNLFVAGAQVAGIASGVSLIMFGYYPELFTSEHSFWTTALFVSLFLALLLANAGLFTYWKYSKLVGYVGLTAVAMMAVFVASRFAMAQISVFEWISLALAMAWMIAMAQDMYVTFT